MILENFFLRDTRAAYLEDERLDLAHVMLKGVHGCARLGWLKRHVHVMRIILALREEDEAPGAALASANLSLDAHRLLVELHPLGPLPQVSQHTTRSSKKVLSTPM
jgi:hypothetical protein